MSSILSSGFVGDLQQPFQLCASRAHFLKEIIAPTHFSHMGQKYPGRLDKHQQCLWMRKFPVTGFWWPLCQIQLAEGQPLCVSDEELRLCLMENNGNFWQLCQNHAENKWSGLWLLVWACLRDEESYGFVSSFTEQWQSIKWLRNVSAGWK